MIPSSGCKVVLNAEFQKLPIVLTDAVSALQLIGAHSIHSDDPSVLHGGIQRAELLRRHDGHGIIMGIIMLVAL